MAPSPFVEFLDVRLGYGRRTVLDRVSMDVRAGDLLGLVGPTGAGKTTLLRALLGTIDPLAGRVVWAGGRRPRIGYVPQRESLDPVWPLSCLDVVLMGRCALRGPLRRLGAGDRVAARSALDAAGIDDLAASSVADLSGGQVQRVLLARALASEPDLLVLDEPTTGMDLEGADAMLGLVRRLHDERRLTVVLVSHDLNAVAAVATRVALIHEGTLREGDVESILSAEVLGAVYGLPVAVGTVGGRRVVSVEHRP